MRVFITGASGFVGGAAARHLSGRHEVFAMSRSEQSDRKIEAQGASPVRCALNAVAVSDLLGIDVVIHCAARVDDWGRESDFDRDNVEGTRQLLACASEAGVRRFIHIGTEAALFRGQPMRDVDETYPLAPDSPFLYSRTKAKAEQAVVGATGLETIVLRPRMIWGEGDLTILPRILEMQEKGQFAWIDGGRISTSTTHIANLVHAIELALTRGAPGSAYFILDDGAVRFRDFMTDYAATAGAELSSRSIPGGVARTAASLLETLWKTFGVQSAPPLTRFSANILSRDCILKDDKARAELGYAPVVSRAEGMAQCAAAHRAQAA